jgi:hypothetical protein
MGVAPLFIADDVYVGDDIVVVPLEPLPPLRARGVVVCFTDEVVDVPLDCVAKASPESRARTLIKVGK